VDAERPFERLAVVIGLLPGLLARLEQPVGDHAVCLLE
jgi:hypothetical protein